MSNGCPRALNARTCSTYSRGWTRRSCSSVARGRLDGLPAEPVAALELGLDRADALRPLGVAVPGVVLERRRVAEEPGHGRRVRYRRALDETSRTDVAVVGAGAAGLYAALVAAAEGASVALVSRSPLAQTASYWAQGGIAAALADGDSPERHARGHDRRRPRRGARERRPGALRGVARPRARPPGARRALRRGPERQPRARPGGRPLGAPNRPRRRRGDRPAHHPRAVRARRHRRAHPRARAGGSHRARERRRRPLRRPHRAPARGRPARPVGARGDPRHRRDGRPLGSAPRTRAARSARG